MQALSKTARIRELNDAFRTTFRGGLVTTTPGVDALSSEQKDELIRAVREFKDSNVGNDLYNEHDFGSIEIDGETFFWKIEYYDRTMQQGSEDPSDPEKTTRVLTIMLADEY